jgi:hypothetical protein
MLFLFLLLLIFIIALLSFYLSVSLPQFEEAGPHFPGASRRPRRLDCHLFSERERVQLREDLVDPHIYICAPEVLALFSDNFDYQVGCPPPFFFSSFFSSPFTSTLNPKT